VLYRSDALYPDDELGLPLPGWPPTAVVDLRSTAERERCGTAAWPPSTRAYHVPLLDAAAPHVLDRPLTDLYLHMLDTAGPLIADIAAIIATAPGSTLVQCAAGKDRTGVAIAVILLSIGVRPEQVVADYVATAPNMPGVVARITARIGVELPSFDDLPRYVREAPASAIGAVIEVVSRGPDGAAGWLAGHGASHADLQRLRARLGSLPP
jgi:hypothetical protein